MNSTPDRYHWTWSLDADVEPQFDESLQLIGYWASKGSGGIPLRTDLDASVIHTFIPNLFVASFDPARADYCYDVVGQEVASAFDIDDHGRLVGQVFPDPATAQAIRRLYHRVIREERPIVSAGEVQGPGGARATVEIVRLPVRETAARTVILGAIFFIDALDEVGDDRPAVRATPCRGSSGRRGRTPA